MPDMNENAETQQEYFGKVRTDNTKTLYNALNKIAELEEKLANADYQLEGREVELKELNKKLSQAEADYDKMFWQKNEIISNLQAQIEKMKCCTNCRYCIKEWGEVNPNSPNCKKCNNKSNWKLRR